MKLAEQGMAFNLLGFDMSRHVTFYNIMRKRYGFETLFNPSENTASFIPKK